MNHVTDTTNLPLSRIGGGRLPPCIYQAAPNPIPAGKCNLVMDCRAFSGISASSPRRVTTAARGLRPAGGGLLNFVLASRQLGGDLRCEGTERLPCVGALHGSNHEASYDQEVVPAFQERGNVHQ